MSSKGFCEVHWCIEADIANDHLIFITGDPDSLGCWEPEMAVVLSSSTERANFWNIKTMVPCGIHFKYNYFIKAKGESFCNIIWRPGPEISVSIPIIRSENDMIVVRDSWMKTIIQRLPILSWESWMADIDFPDCHIKHEGHHASSSGEKKTMRSLNGALLHGKQSSVNFLSKEYISPNNDENTNACISDDALSERNQPVEEPWLLRSTLASLMVTNDPEEVSIQDSTHKVELPGKLHHDREKVAPEDAHKLTRIEEPASTVILINSSVCSMQRIAVLEDGKLVELLLEPVKNNVQCDSIYLGIVTKLVPHMGGAFVDIGISRPSLLDIKKNREPFVYPPFHHFSRQEPANGSANVERKEQLDTDELDQSSDDDDDTTDEILEVDGQNDSLQFIHEDYENRHEVEDVGVSDSHKLTMNNGANDVDDGEADFDECYDENGHNLDEYVNDVLPLEEETSNGSELSRLIEQDLNGSNKVNANENKWAHIKKGTKVIVQVVKEVLGTKGPALSAYPTLRSRFWILLTRCTRIGVSKKITGVERTRLKVIAKTLQPRGFGLTVRTVAVGHSLDELHKDLDSLLYTWKTIVEQAKSAALAADEGVEGAVPVMLHRAMGQTLTVVQDYFNEKVRSMVVDSPRTYHEVTSYLQEIAPDLCGRVELYDKRTPIFDEYNIEEEINNILSKRVPLSNGGSLVIEQTEALVSIDVNGGHGMLGQGTSQEKAVLDVNLAAAKQIARELRLRDIGGIIVVDFIDMDDESNKRLVYEETKKAVERDGSLVRVSELSKHGLMEITRKRVRPSVSFMISEPCTCCHATGRVEALDTSFSKIEHEICRLLAASNQKPDPGNAKSWPRFILRVDRHMCNYFTSGKRTKLARLSSSLKVWILLKVARGFSRGQFEVKHFTEDKTNDEQQVAISRLRPTEARTYIPNTKLTLFPVKKWRSRGK